jgi:hypothetical protein
MRPAGRSSSGRAGASSSTTAGRSCRSSIEKPTVSAGRGPGRVRAARPRGRRGRPPRRHHGPGRERGPRPHVARLQPAQDELVRRVAAANPRTIVVVSAGSPVADAVARRRGRGPADLVPRPGGRQRPGGHAARPSRAGRAAADHVAGRDGGRADPRHAAGRRLAPLHRGAGHRLPGLAARRDRPGLPVRPRPRLHDVDVPGRRAGDGRRLTRGFGPLRNSGSRRAAKSSSCTWPARTARSSGRSVARRLRGRRGRAGPDRRTSSFRSIAGRSGTGTRRRAIGPSSRASSRSGSGAASATCGWPPSSTSKARSLWSGPRYTGVAGRCAAGHSGDLDLVLLPGTWAFILYGIGIATPYLRTDLRLTASRPACTPPLWRSGRSRPASAPTGWRVGSAPTGCRIWRSRSSGPASGCRLAPGPAGLSVRGDADRARRRARSAPTSTSASAEPAEPRLAACSARPTRWR